MSRYFRLRNRAPAESYREGDVGIYLVYSGDILEVYLMAIRSCLAVSRSLTVTVLSSKV